MQISNTVVNNPWRGAVAAAVNYIWVQGNNGIFRNQQNLTKITIKYILKFTELISYWEQDSKTTLPMGTY